MSQLPLTVGTAGHIDHGKTALVKALTGKHTDRLPEEHRRGISIELGYARLDLGERHLSLIDVPGHERFVKTMIAGATGIDIFLLVVDARESVMPQTEEHLLVLRSLGITDGVCAITKCDLAEPADIRRSVQEARELVPGVPVIETSATTRAGVGELRGALYGIARTVTAARQTESEVGRPAVLHVDRVFTLKGHGTIVTGTLWSGCLKEGQKVVIEPNGTKARIRSIQVHDQTVDVAGPRQRVALNLAGIDRDRISRGDVVAGEAGEVDTTYRVDATLKPVDLAVKLHGKRVQVHHGTRDSPARLLNLKDDGLAQLRLENQLLTREGDHLVLRSISNQRTLGGGQITDTSPLRRGPDSRVRSGTHATTDPPENNPEQYSNAPTGTGSTTTEPVETPTDPASSHVLRLLANAGLRPPRADEIAEQLGIDSERTATILDGLTKTGEIVRLTDSLYVDSKIFAEAVERIVKWGRRAETIKLSEVRDLLGVGRRATQLILERCDRERITLRRGDVRYLRSTRG